MYQYAKPYEHIEGSFIRNILKLASQKEYISFAGGLPDNELFPRNALEEIFKYYSKKLPNDIFQYAPTPGSDKLIKTIQKEFKLKSDLLITNGAQQALDLISAVFINAGDKVLIEEPSFLGATGLFKSYGAICESIPLEKDGINLKALEKKLKKNKYKFFYVIPNFQNPSCFTYSKSKRKALAKLAMKYKLVIIEDDPYGYLHFKNRRKAKIYDYAPNQTIYIGSFSKVFIPALRIGYIMANSELMAKINIAKQYKDLHTNMFTQYILLAFLNHFDIRHHIQTLQESYAKKGLFFYKHFKKELGDLFEVHKPKGGMFIWARLKDGRDTKALLQDAIEQKVLYVPGIFFCENQKNKSHIRFNFTNSNKKEIKEGIRRLNLVFR